LLHFLFHFSLLKLVIVMEYMLYLHTRLHDRRCFDMMSYFTVWFDPLTPEYLFRAVYFLMFSEARRGKDLGFSWI